VPLPPTPPAAATPDTCWRVQVASLATRAKAEQLRRAAESLLLVPIVVEPEKRRYTVRSRDCMDRSGAELLRQRARASGLGAATRIRDVLR